MIEKLKKKLPPPNNRAKLVHPWQSTGEIIKAIKIQHKDNFNEARKICKYFDKGNERDTARAIHGFLRQNIKYDVEPGNRQTVKTLSRFLHDRKGDCKHFTIFANTILDACGYTAAYRYAGYSDKGFVHVYTYLPGTNTILDAVLPEFDTEKPPKIKKDYIMSLYKLSGTQDEIGKLNFSKVRQNIKTAAAKTSNVVKKAAASIPAAAKKIVATGKTVSLAVPRNAFIALIKLNVRGLATNLKEVQTKKGDAGLNFWQTFGGDLQSLKKAIADGSKKKRIMGPQEEEAAFNEIYGGYSGDGVYIGEPVTIAASLASAAPILLKVKDVLEKAGIKGEELKKVADVAKKAQNDFKNITGKSLTDVVFKKDAGTTTTKIAIKPADLQPLPEKTAEKIATAAVAAATGTDIQTINEIKEETTATSKIEPLTAVLPDVPGGTTQKPQIKLNNTLIFGGLAAGALVLFLLNRKS